MDAISTPNLGGLVRQVPQYFVSKRIVVPKVGQRVEEAAKKEVQITSLYSPVLLNSTALFSKTGQEKSHRTEQSKDGQQLLEQRKFNKKKARG